MAPSIADDGHTVDEIDEALAWATRCDWRSGWAAFVDALLDERLSLTAGRAPASSARRSWKPAD